MGGVDQDHGRMVGDDQRNREIGTKVEVRE